MKNNYLLIHGSFGSPFVNWFPWLREEIESRRKHTMSRSLKKGPYVDAKLLARIEKMNENDEKGSEKRDKKVIKTIFLFRFLYF